MLVLTYASPADGGRMLVEVGAMSMKWKIYTKTVETEDGGVATHWFWRKPVLEARDEGPEGFTSQAGFWRKPGLEGRDESPEGFTSQAGFWRKPRLEGGDESPKGFTSQAECEADAAQHGYTPEKIVEHFSGSYTCRAQTLPFKYEGCWEMRSGMIHWAATIQFLSSFWDVRGTLFEDCPTRITDEVRHSVGRSIEAFSCGQASSR
jgi:hypothetical protein